MNMRAIEKSLMSYRPISNFLGTAGGLGIGGIIGLAALEIHGGEVDEESYLLISLIAFSFTLVGAGVDVYRWHLRSQINKSEEQQTQQFEDQQIEMLQNQENQENQENETKYKIIRLNEICAIMHDKVIKPLSDDEIKQYKDYINTLMGDIKKQKENELAAYENYFKDQCSISWKNLKELTLQSPITVSGVDLVVIDAETKTTKEINWSSTYECEGFIKHIRDSKNFVNPVTKHSLMDEKIIITKGWNKDINVFITNARECLPKRKKSSPTLFFTLEPKETDQMSEIILDDKRVTIGINT